MFRGERIQPLSEKEKNLHGNIKIYLVRHGEAVRNNGQEPTLTEKGKEQGREVARSAFSSIRERLKQGIGANIFTLYAPKDRTTNTAKEIEDECRRLVREENLSSIIVFKSAPSPLLEAANSIEPIIKIGATKQQAISVWLASTERALAKLGVKTFPSQVHKNLIRLINGSENLDKRWGGTRDNIVFWVTQETVQAALLSYLSYKEPVVIDFAERIEIVPVIPGDEIRFSFRGVHFSRKKLKHVV